MPAQRESTHLQSMFVNYGSKPEYQERTQANEGIPCKLQPEGPQEMKEKNRWHRPTIIIITLIAVIAVVALVTIAVLQNRPLIQKYKYGIVMDAGSSHTSLFIYQWPAEKQNNTGRVEQMHSCHVKGPGISSYASEPVKAGQSLTACMMEAKRWIPESRYQETPLYLGATAGMRLLNIEDSAVSDSVLHAVEAALQKFPFSYQGARILSGREEGAYGWVTVNYLDDRLTKGLETTGALDLGGASTQISYVSKNFNGSESPSNSVNFRLYGNDYNLYTHSFLCYGQDQALKMVMSQLSQSGSRKLENPCLHPGFTVSMNYSELYDSPCVSDLKPNDLPPGLTQNGTGNFKQCQEVIKTVFNFTYCTFSRCSFNGIFQPILQGHYGAFSAYYYTMSFLGLTDTRLSLDAVRDIVAHHCSKPWSQVLQEHPDVKVKYLHKYCFSGVYLLMLLTKGYNFTSENYPNIKYVEKIKGSDAGWTLGYMLNLTNMIPAEAQDKPPLPFGGYVTVVTSIGIVLLILFFLTLRPLWPRGSKEQQIE